MYILLNIVFYCLYRADQSFKYFLVNKETSAREVVMLALQEFQDLNNHNSRDYALFQVRLYFLIILPYTWLLICNYNEY